MMNTKSITSYSDGKLIWIVHFDRNNYQRIWVEECEAELARRQLSLHKIDESYLKTIRRKVIEPDIDIWKFAPRDPFRLWYLIPLILVFNIATGVSEVYLTFWPALFLAGFVFFLFSYLIDPRYSNKLRRQIAWVSIIAIIVLGIWFDFLSPRK